MTENWAGTVTFASSLADGWFPLTRAPRPPKRRCTVAHCGAFVSQYNFSHPAKCWCHTPAPRPESTESLMTQRVSVAG